MSDGSPVSPVFEKPEGLANWLIEGINDTTVTKGTTFDQWMKFIEGPGWAPTMSATLPSGDDLKLGVQAE